MSLSEVLITLLLVVVMSSMALEGRYHKTTVLRELRALHAVYDVINKNLLDNCAKVYGYDYGSLDALRNAIDWQEPLNSETDTEDWRIEVGRAPLDRFMRITVRYPNNRLARDISAELSPYTSTYIATTTTTGHVNLSWVISLDRDALEHSQGLEHYRYYGKLPTRQVNHGSC